jgi:hypothetical protein
MFIKTFSFIMIFQKYVPIYVPYIHIFIIVQTVLTIIFGHDVKIAELVK